MSKCLDVENFDSDRRLIKYFEDQMRKDGLDSQFGNDEENPKRTSITKSILNFLRMKPLTGIKAQKAIDKAVRKFVNPKKDEQAALAYEIASRIHANPLIQDLMYHEIVREADKYKADNPLSKIEWFTNDKVERVPRLETLPIPALRCLRTTEV